MSEQENNGTEPAATAPPAAEPPANSPPAAPAPPSAPENKAPDWFMADKYTSIEEQARAQYDMQNKIGKHWCPPKDDYLIEGIDGIKIDDPVVAHMKPLFKEIGLSQEGFNTILKGHQDAYSSVIKAQEEAFQKGMTPERAARINEVNKIISERLPPAIAEKAKEWVTSHEDFDALDYFVKQMPQSTNVPSSTNAAATRFESTKDVEADKVKYLNEIKAGLKVEDKTYRNQLNQRFADAWKRENKK